MISENILLRSRDLILSWRYEMHDLCFGQLPLLVISAESSTFMTVTSLGKLTCKKLRNGDRITLLRNGELVNLTIDSDVTFS